MEGQRILVLTAAMMAAATGMGCFNRGTPQSVDDGGTDASADSGEKDSHGGAASDVVTPPLRDGASSPTTVDAGHGESPGDSTGPAPDGPVMMPRPPDAGVDAGPEQCVGPTCPPRYLGTNRLGPVEIMGRKVGNMAVTSDGTTVLTGTFTGTIDFDPGPGVTSLTASGTHDHFVTVFASDGRHAWTRAVGGAATTNQALYRVAITADGSVVVSGYFGGTLEVSPSASEAKLTARAPAGDGYVIRFGPDGRPLFLRARTSLKLSACHASGVDVASDDTTLVSGSCFDRVEAQGTDGFVMKLDRQGEPLYSRSFVAVQGGNGVPLVRPFTDGSVLVAGHFDGRVDLDPGDGTDVRTVASGTNVMWALTTGGPFSIGHRVALGPTGFALLGQFGQSGDFDPGPGVDVQPKPTTSTHYVTRFAF